MVCSRFLSLCGEQPTLSSKMAPSFPHTPLACVAWRFNQFEREHTKRRSRENELRKRLRRSLSRLSRLPSALKLLKNHQATQANTPLALHVASMLIQSLVITSYHSRFMTGNNKLTRRYETWLYSKANMKKTKSFWVIDRKRALEEVLTH